MDNTTSLTHELAWSLDTTPEAILDGVTNIKHLREVFVAAAYGDLCARDFVEQSLHRHFHMLQKSDDLEELLESNPSMEDLEDFFGDEDPALYL